LRYSKPVLILIFVLAAGLCAKAADERFAALDQIINEAIEQKVTPGAVLIVGHDGKTAYKKAYGFRTTVPSPEPMTEDTVFDLASLTKPIATATAVMKLFEEGKVRLNDPVARYIPEFGNNGKEEITVRQLMTHFSGLRAGLDMVPAWAGKEEAYRKANSEKPIVPPGSQFIYSDIDYIVLGQLVERVSGMPLDAYVQKNVLEPLDLEHTRYLPPADWVSKTAATDKQRGVVHDPTARMMGGVAGHAGLFATAGDVAKFAKAVLEGKLPLSPLTQQKMQTPQQPATSTVLRGLGWDIDSPYSSNRGELFPVGSFGHTGFAGTSLWMDPVTKTYVVLLTNAVHYPLKSAQAIVSLRSRVATAVAAALELSPSEREVARLVSNTGYNESMTGSRRILARNGNVKTGIDVLEEQQFKLLRGDGGTVRRIALVTNQTGVDSFGRRTIDVLARVSGVELRAIFSPEHGMTGMLDTTDVGDTKDAATGIPVYSVYGAKDASRRPKPEQLAGIDAIVFDIQDAGARFYTYETTLGYFLEAAAKQGIEIFVMERPNPINGSFVQGPVSDSGIKSFVNYHSLPVRHGMTIGELARMFNTERDINAKLTVVPMQGWLRGDWFDSTGLEWINPSPNLRSVTQAALYPGVALVEGTNISVGRGTDSPFEVVGAPWIVARELATFLNARNLSGVRFVPVSFTPTSSNYANERCNGVRIVLLDRNVLDAPELGVELASALLKLYPQQYKIDRMNELLVNSATFEAIKAGNDPRRIADEWRDGLEKFRQTRAKYLLY
jgi:uncharacterized protein YbbC (DUF1343 family)/CubicO group peptidase (beta-lactamase class C family)